MSATLDQRRRAAQDIVPGDIEWDGTRGKFTCPAGHPDAIVYLDGVVTFSCFHTSCQDAFADWNRQLRAACLEDMDDEEPSPEDKERQALRKECRAKECATRRIVLPRLLALPPVDVETLPATSPFRLAEDCRDDWKSMLRALYEQHVDRRIWCGELWQTGGEEHARKNFRTRDEWLARKHAPGPQLGVSEYFQPYGRVLLERKKRFALPSAYVVCESDTVARENFVNVLWHIRDRLGLILRAIVDTGSGRSIHGWFDRPQPPECDMASPESPWGYGGEGDNRPRMDDLRSDDPRMVAWHREYDRYERARQRWAIRLKTHDHAQALMAAYLRGIGCDAQMIKPGGTARLAGWEREGDDWNDDWSSLGWQTLLWLDPRYEIT